jgi:hypothetical protein
LAVKDDFIEKEETKEVVLDDKIEKNSLDDKEDIKMKKIKVWKLIKKHHSLDEDGVTF